MSRPAGNRTRRVRHVVLTGLLSVLVMAGGGEAGGPTAPSLSVESAATAGDVRITIEGLGPGWIERIRHARLTDDQWEHLLALRTGGPGSSSQPAMLGRYTLASGRLTFEPRWPLRSGLRYDVTCDLEGLAHAAGIARPAGSPARLERRIELPGPHPVSAARVTEVYPSIAVVPANLLKFYVHFSAPMMQGEAARYVRLYDADGRLAQDAFLRLDEELWNAEGTRLTVFLDPGRIKRGLRPHRELGGPLRAGTRYRLHVDAAWPDAEGAPLRSGIDRWLTVVADDRVAPAIAGWRVTTPPAGSQAPLEVRAPEPLDHALAERMIGVRDAAGARVPVVARLGEGDRVIRLTPERAWQAGDYRVELDAELEDLAGNSFRRLFDVDLDDPRERPRDDLRSVTLEVRVR